MQLFKKTSFDFVGKRYAAYAVSFLLLGAGVASLIAKGGPKRGIDFTGGTLVQIKFAEDVPLNRLRDKLSAKGYGDAELQSIGTQHEVMVRLLRKEISTDQLAEQLRAAAAEEFPNAKPVVERAEYVGPAVGAALSAQALKAIFWSLGLIIIYIAIRFRSFLWGFCSVIALAHDVLAVVGVFSMLDKEITITVVAGILTLAGYSMNDTVVIYDRMRENLRLSRKEPLADLINRSLNETLSRTVMTTATTLAALVVFYLFGGEVIHDFAFAMLFGIFVGTYSSLFVAAPIIYEFQSRSKR